MSNSEKLADVINSVLGETAPQNTLAVKVAQEIVEREFNIGQKLADMVFGNGSFIADEQQTLAEKIASFRAEQIEYDHSVDAEYDAIKTRLYLEQYA